MNQSESIKGLLEGLVKAQSEFKTLPKDKEGYGYKYTDLDTVISTVRPILIKHNIGFMQTLTTVNGRDGLTTRLFNTAGEWIEDTFLLPAVTMAKTNAAQNVGASITYMKRYALCAVLGISSDEDTDARPQTQNNDQKGQQKNQTQQQTPAGGWDTKEQRARINELLATTLPDGSKMFNSADCRAMTAMRATKTADEVIKMINEEIAARLKSWEETQPKQEAPEVPEEVF